MATSVQDGGIAVVQANAGIGSLFHRRPEAYEGGDLAFAAAPDFPPENL